MVLKLNGRIYISFGNNFLIADFAVVKTTINPIIPVSKIILK